MSTEPAHNDVLLAPGRAQRLHLAGGGAPSAELDVGTTDGAWVGGRYSGGAGGGDGAGGGGGAGGGSGDAEGVDDALQAVLRARRASTADVPADVLRAYRAGLISAENVSNYLIASRNAVSALLMAVGGAGMRNRFLADKLFLLKVAIEEGIGVFGKLSAEYEQRRHRFWEEKEFVFANLISAILADFALVYLPAPSVRLTPAAPGRSFASWVSNVAAGLPSNVFQTDRPFTLAQRGAGFALKGAQLFGVGFLCAFTGIMFTNGIVALRERFDKNYTPSTQKQNPFLVSLLYAVFLGVSSGSRYQLVNGIENHIFPRLFVKTPKLAEEMATFALRYGNTFWGSQQWVMFCRYTNAQKLKPE